MRQQPTSAQICWHCSQTSNALARQVQASALGNAPQRLLRRSQNLAYRYRFETYAVHDGLGFCSKR